METKSIGFIGGGRITRIFLQALKNKQFDLGSILISDSDQNVLDQLKKQFSSIQVTSDNTIPAKREFVIIALHPPAITGVLGEIKNEISEKTILLSLAPKISIQKFKSILNISKVVRLIPNATSVINEGYNPVCFSENLNNSEKNNLLDWLQKLGTTFEVDEKKLEAYALVSAMAPTYFWFQWQKLVEIGKEFGLEASESEQAVYQSLRAALNVQFNDTLTYNEVCDLIPVKPIRDHEEEINHIYEEKLKDLFAKISSQG